MKSALDRVLVLVLIGLLLGVGLCLLDGDSDAADLCLVFPAATLAVWVPLPLGRAGHVLPPAIESIALVPLDSPPTPP